MELCAFLTKSLFFLSPPPTLLPLPHPPLPPLPLALPLSLPLPPLPLALPLRLSFQLYHALVPVFFPSHSPFLSSICPSLFLSLQSLSHSPSLSLYTRSLPPSLSLSHSCSLYVPLSCLPLSCPLSHTDSLSLS